MKIASLKRWNVLDAFLILFLSLIAVSFYFTFVQPVRFSNTIQREGVLRYVMVEMALVEDSRSGKGFPPIGYERPDVYGRTLWKVLEWHETIKEGQKLRKARVKILVEERKTGEIYYGRYLLEEGKSIYLSWEKYALTGRILKSQKLDEKVFF